MTSRFGVGLLSEFKVEDFEGFRVLAGQAQLLFSPCYLTRTVLFSGSCCFVFCLGLFGFRHPTQGLAREAALLVPQDEVLPGASAHGCCVKLRPELKRHALHKASLAGVLASAATHTLAQRRPPNPADSWSL